MISRIKTKVEGIIWKVNFEAPGMSRPLSSYLERTKQVCIAMLVGKANHIEKVL